MSLVVIGLNHRSVPIEILERVTIDNERLGKALRDLADRPYLSEAVVLSTCNRTEIYAVAEKFHGAYGDVRTFIAEMAHMAPEDFSDHLYVHYDESAVSHLFRVAAGLDSAVVGETEILGQVRSAWTRAQDEQTTGSALNLLFRHAIEVGKRARTETDIARHVASVSTAAVALAADQLNGLSGRCALVLGAGRMGERMARALAAAGVDDLVIANRTWARAVELAESVGGRAIHLADIPAALVNVDLLLTGTGASSMILEFGDLHHAISQRDGRQLLVVDVAVPRDVDPAAGDLDGVTLLDMEDLRAFAQVGIDQRKAEVAAVEAIVDEEQRRFSAASLAREVAPLIASLHDQAEGIRSSEIERFNPRLSGLDDQQLEAVEALTRAIVAKLIHQPTLGVKDNVGTPRGERLATSLRELFDL